MAGVWCEVLGVERVGRGQDFFELGGHSLLATQVVARLRTIFGVEVGLRQVFERPTVAGLAEAVGRARGVGGGGAAAGAVVRVERGGALPLSYGQERMWFLARLEPGGSAYNLASGVRVTGALDVGALRRAVREVVRRHEVLRTRVVEVNGRPAQVIESEAGGEVCEVELRGLGAGAEAEAERVARAVAGRGIDLGEVPQVRAAVARVGEWEAVGVLTLHHAVTDAWSQRLLVGEVTGLYGAYAAGEESPLPELAIQYADYAVWQREWLRGEELERQLGYWREQLADLPPLELPTDRARPAVQSHRGGHERLLLSEGTAAALRALSRREGSTLYMTLLAAFKLLLFRYTGQVDLAVGMAVANRTHEEVENLIGFFVNTLVLRTGLSGGVDFRELLRRVREVCLGAYAHQDLPFERLVEELAPERDMGRNPLAQVFCVLQNYPARGAELPGLTVRAVEAEARTTKFDLTLFAAETEGGLQAAFEYSADLFEAGTVRRMLSHFRTLLEAVVADPALPLSHLPLMEESERRQLLTGWGRGPAAYPDRSCVHHLFAEQVMRAPHAPALSYERRTLSYQELDRRSNQLAHHLRSLGVGPESVVSLCLERSVELVVSLLAVLKAGGAYLALDPEDPPARRARLLAD
ncbi:MAG TPA: condensation domain-containing protein, partial [Longimicrobium sp.]|nr:condensation domain-containing protein [Longimicrobium sp.]